MENNEMGKAAAELNNGVYYSKKKHSTQSSESRLPAKSEWMCIRFTL